MPENPRVDERERPPRARPTSVPTPGLVLLIVVANVVLVVGLGILVPRNRIGSRFGYPSDTAVQQMENIGAAISIFVHERGSLPNLLADLTVPSGKTDEPFMLKVPLDPWRSPYAYRILDAATQRFQITSAGEDGRMGTDDELSQLEGKQEGEFLLPADTEYGKS